MLEAKSKELRANDRDETQDFGLLAEVSHLLYRVGLRQESAKLEAMLEKYADRNQSEEMHATELLKIWSENSRRRRATEYLSKFLDKKYKLKSFSRDIRPQFESMMTIVYPSFQGVACRILFVLRERDPDATWNTIFDQLETLYLGSMPDGWRGKDFETFAWQVHNPEIDDDLSTTQVANVMAKLSRELGFPTLAIAILRASPQYASTILSIATIRAEVGDYEGALRMIDNYPNFLPTDLELQLQRINWLNQIGAR